MSFPLDLPTNLARRPMAFIERSPVAWIGRVPKCDGDIDVIQVVYGLLQSTVRPQDAFDMEADDNGEDIDGKEMSSHYIISSGKRAEHGCEVRTE